MRVLWHGSLADGEILGRVSGTRETAQWRRWLIKEYCPVHLFHSTRGSSEIFDAAHAQPVAYRKDMALGDARKLPKIKKNQGRICSRRRNELEQKVASARKKLTAANESLKTEVAVELRRALWRQSASWK